MAFSVRNSFESEGFIASIVDKIILEAFCMTINDIKSDTKIPSNIARAKVFLIWIIEYSSPVPTKKEHSTKLTPINAQLKVESAKIVERSSDLNFGLSSLVKNR
jgi:hypothetical protein